MPTVSPRMAGLPVAVKSDFQPGTPLHWSYIALGSVAAWPQSATGCPWPAFAQACKDASETVDSDDFKPSTKVLIESCVPPAESLPAASCCSR